MKLSGYDSLCAISQSNRSVVFRAVRIQDQLPVILKAAAVVDSVYQKVAIEREHEILKGMNLEGVARLLGVEEHENEPVLVFEDSGGQDIKAMIDSGSRDRFR
jgi:serine/threonine protein kinase